MKTRAKWQHKGKCIKGHMLSCRKEMNFLIFGVATRESYGFEVARILLAGGHVVIVVCHTEASREPLRQAFEPHAPQILVADVLSEAQLSAVVALARKSVRNVHGVLHCVAGGGNSLDSIETARELLSGPYRRLTYAQASEAFQVCVHSLARIAHLCAEGSRPLLAPGGSITSLSFIYSQLYLKSMGPMSLLKTALESLVKTLAVELGDLGRSYRVNALRLPLNTASRVGQLIRCPEDLRAALASTAPETAPSRAVSAEAVVWLMTRAKSITGQVIGADGGQGLQLPMSCEKETPVENQHSSSSIDRQRI